MRQMKSPGSSERQVSGRTGFRSAGMALGERDEVLSLPGFAAWLLSTQEAEQRRISREIHDDLGQKLALLEIQVENMKRTPPSESRLVSELESLRGSVSDLAEDLKRICHSLHPVILDNLGLVVGIECLCEEYTKTSGIAVKFLRSDIPPVPSGISLCLYRVVQEALHNVAKHACTKRATVGLGRSDDGIQVTIQDAGCGFDPLIARKYPARPKHGLGLISLGERVRLLGGRCEVRSQRGRGTQISVFIPFSSSATGNDFQMD
jgi:signal transduction histidine kinase